MDFCHVTSDEVSPRFASFQSFQNFVDMGNDGGTIAKGQDLKAIHSLSAEQKPTDSLHKDDSTFSMCSLTSLPLFQDNMGQPVMSDFKGHMFLKEKVIELLLLKRTSPSKIMKLPHVNSLNDLVDLRISWSSDGLVTCPVTGATAVNHHKFAYLRPCGCVISYKLLTDIRQLLRISDRESDVSTSECPKCGVEFKFNYDIVLLDSGVTKQTQDFNIRNFEYLKETLRLSHSKKRLKLAKKKRKPSERKHSGRVDK